MGIFDDARQILKDAAVDAAEEVVIIRYDGQRVTAPARIGNKVFKLYNGEATVAVITRRFIFNLVDIANKAPENLDRLVWRGRIFRPGNPDGGAPWRWHGSDNTMIAVYATDAGEYIEEGTDNE